ncbi:hypothetical protein Dimus_036455, partial [Dionaea muscipula]
MEGIAAPVLLRMRVLAYCIKEARDLHLHVCLLSSKNHIQRRLKISFKISIPFKISVTNPTNSYWFPLLLYAELVIIDAGAVRDFAQTIMARASVTPFVSEPSDHISLLSGDNFSDWKNKIFQTLGCMDMDLALRVEEPPIPTESSTVVEIATHEKWERSNRLSMMFAKSHVSKSPGRTGPRR